jgi:hypothetical protein
MALRGVERTPSMTALESGATHEPRNALAPAAHPRARQFGMDPRDPVRPAACRVDRADLLGQARVSPCVG